MNGSRFCSHTVWPNVALAVVKQCTTESAQLQNGSWPKPIRFWFPHHRTCLWNHHHLICPLPSVTPSCKQHCYFTGPIKRQWHSSVGDGVTLRIISGKTQWHYAADQPASTQARLYLLARSTTTAYNTAAGDPMSIWRPSNVIRYFCSMRLAINLLFIKWKGGLLCLPQWQLLFSILFRLIYQTCKSLSAFLSLALSLIHIHLYILPAL